MVSPVETSRLRRAFKNANFQLYVEEGRFTPRPWALAAAKQNYERALAALVAAGLDDELSKDAA